MKAFSEEKAPLCVVEDELETGLQSTRTKTPLYTSEETTTRRSFRRLRSLLPSSFQNCSTCGVAAKHFRYALLALGALAVCFFTRHFFFPRHAWMPAHRSSIFPMAGSHHMVKPAGVKIVGLVFFGRPLFVDILDCYLQRNLVVNGGWLDEIQFMAHTNNTMDLQWLEEFIPTQPQYKFVNCTLDDYADIWSHADDAETIYIKIDDDIVFVHDDAIPQIVSTLIAHPETYAVASNLINSPLTAWLAYHVNALHPFLPEMTPYADFDLSHSAGTWRPSELPMHSGTTNSTFNLTQMPTAPYKGHRWLPLETNPDNLLKTPIAGVTPGDTNSALGLAWLKWTIAAQQHMSFFKNVEDNRLDRYHAGSEREGIWNMQFERYNINFMAVRGKTLLDRPFWFDPATPNDALIPASQAAAASLDLAARRRKESGRDRNEHVRMRMNLDFNADGKADVRLADDEWAMTQVVPLELRKPVLVQTRALVAHFAFYPQVEQMRRTDILDRYRAYANEMVCAADNQKARLRDELEF